MTLLTVLTLIYAAVLILALAGSLIMILLYLRRIASALGETHATLETVRDRTGGLDQPLTVVHEAIQESLTPFEQTGHSLQEAESALKKKLPDETVAAGSGES